MGTDANAGLDGPASPEGSPDAGTTADAGTPPSCPPSWTVTPACGGSTGGPAPDFGPMPCKGVLAGDVRLLVAAVVGPVRLIDNCPASAS